MGAPAKIRTLLIDDSAFMRRFIGDIIKSDPSLELVATAKNGHEVNDLVKQLEPQVLITDMVMPDYDGLYVVSEIMRSKPIPIILLSSLERTDRRIFDALAKGAFDFIDKPSGIASPDLKNFRLLELIKQASITDVSVLKRERRRERRNSSAHSFDTLRYEIVVIGASTGGPSAVESVLTNLPENLQVPVVVVQHMPHRFLETFTERLNDVVPMSVQLANKGEPLQKGNIYIAPGMANIKIEKSVSTGLPIFTLTERKFVEYNYPSVDCLFESVASVYGSKSIGVILTGMGRDGTAGLKKIKEAGGFTIAQDEQSSVVYGMPRSANENGAAKQVVALREIPGFIISCL